MEIRFFELAGEDAEARLTALGASLRQAGAATRLLRSLDDPTLYLLMAEGAAAAPPEVPPGCRRWAFAAVPRGDG